MRMKNGRDIFKELQQSLGEIKGHLHVLETCVPVEKQMEYFRFSEGVKNVKKPTSIEEQIFTLNSSDSSSSEVKYALTYLAISGDIKAYRALESYNETHKNNRENALFDWATMSLLQAKITLESELSDEKQIFISTGLGGRGDKLRFFAFFKSKNLENFSGYQKELIEKEIPFYIQRYGGEFEEINIADNYFSILFLVDIQIDIKVMLEQAIAECNQYGDFINSSFIITNVKIFSEEDIKKELQNKK
jgi:hypothetical protein